MANSLTTNRAMSNTLATRVATNLGISFNDTMNNLNNGVTPATSMNENLHPSNYVTNGVARMIKLLTYFGGNINNNSLAVEKYYISPNFRGLIACSGQQKGIWYVPFTNTPYAIKFYGPDEYDSNYYNHVYAVPAIIDSSYWTGLKDYTVSVPQEWITAFVQYVSKVPVNITPYSASLTPTSNTAKNYSSSEATQKYQFSFNFWGSITGTLGKASSFAFEYSFYPGAAPKPPVASSTAIAAAASSSNLSTFLTRT